MKNLILITFAIIFSNASLSFAEQFKSRWGVVIGISPVNHTSNFSEPYTRIICKKSSHRNPNNFANIAVGGLIGSVIGNKLSDTHGAGTIGALFGSMMAVDNSQNYQAETCSENTFYRNKRVNYFSHYNIKVRTKRGIVNIQSSTPYSVHDIIYLN
jgi:uncharacterized protein YcfJ